MKISLGIILFIVTLPLCNFGQSKDAITLYKNMDSVIVWGNKLASHRISNFEKYKSQSLIIDETINFYTGLFLYSEIPIKKSSLLTNIKIKVAPLEKNIAAHLIIAQNDSVIFRKEIKNEEIAKDMITIDLSQLGSNFINPTLFIGLDYKSKDGMGFTQKTYRSKKTKFKNFAGMIIAEDGNLKIKKSEDFRADLISNIIFELEYKQ